MSEPARDRAAEVEECERCNGTAITLVDDGDDRWDEVECHMCVNGWVDLEGFRPSGELGRWAMDNPNPAVRGDF